MELRRKIALTIYADLHHLMRATGAEAQDAYESAATNILTLPEIAAGLKLVQMEIELREYDMSSISTGTRK